MGCAVLGDGGEGPEAAILDDTARPRTLRLILRQGALESLVTHQQVVDSCIVVDAELNGLRVRHQSRFESTVLVVTKACLVVGHHSVRHEVV